MTYMNEMLYGNSGKSDEGINIDMEQNLYQKLQKMYVPKLKSILSVNHQEGDRNFVYLGDVTEKSGSFTIYGYNAKLASDLRGGDYGHYVAVPLSTKAATVDFGSVGFLSEDGFVEYVNNKTVNNEKRFTIAPVATDFNVEAKKKIVNNIMESFMKVRKRKCVSFAIEDCTLEEFNAKSLGVLLELIKYIPYRMRKNISFVSHVCQNSKLPDTINLAAYPSRDDIMPRDCVDIENPAAKFIDGAFFGYVEKVFAMSDSEREAYFEKVYEQIEIPALKFGVEVKSDMYLMDISTKELWKNGAASEAVKNIFASLDSVLKIYPEYAQLAGIRLVADKAERTEYIKNAVASAASVQELKAVYENVSGVLGVCSLDVDDEIIEIFKQKASTFISAASDCAELVSVSEEILAIDNRIFDVGILVYTIKTHMGRNLSFEGIFDVYCAFKEKQYIDPGELNICLSEATEGCILNLTGSMSESRDKLAAIERAFESFSLSAEGKDISPLKEVYDSFHARFSGNTSAEAVSKGNSIVYAIEDGMRGYCTFYEIKNYIKSLSEVEVEFDPVLKAKTAAVYKRLTQTLYRQVADAELSYHDIVNLTNEILPATTELTRKGVYDEEIRSGWGEEQYVSDGLMRFATVFNEFLHNVNTCEDLTDLILSHDTSRASIKREETAIKNIFAKYAPVIMEQWMNKNRKLVSSGSLKKAIKIVKKETGQEPFDSAIDIVEYYLEHSGKKKSKKGSLGKIILVAVLILAILAGTGFGIYKLLDKEPEHDVADAKYTISEEEINTVKGYLKAFSGGNLTDAEFVIGTLKSKGKGKEHKFILTVEDKLGSVNFDGRLTVIDGPQKENSKEYVSLKNVKEKKEYAFVLQKDTQADGNKIYVRDVFEIPENLEEHNFDKPLERKNLSKKDSAFCTDVLKYIGYADKLVKAEEKETQKNGDGKEKNAESAAGDGEKQLEGNDAQAKTSQKTGSSK